MTVWDDSFEAQPEEDVDDAISAAKKGAIRITELKTAVSEREDVEHNFKLGIVPFHKAGKCAVLYKGTTAAIAALTDVSEGCIAYDTTLSEMKAYHNGAWEIIVTDHGGLVGLDADDHSQYLNLSKVGQTLSEDLAVDSGVKIDGRDISTDGGVIEVIPTTRGFQAWAGSYSANVVYGPETRDCFVTARCVIPADSSTTTLAGYIGLTLLPDIVVVSNAIPSLILEWFNAITFLVNRGYYWKVYSNLSSVTINKMEVG